jgi:membrane peptidoglycan carboxypeptidase
MSSATRARNVLGLLVAFVVTSMVAGVLAAGLAMPAVGASGVMAKNSVTFFNSLPGDLATPPTSQRSTMLAADGSVITTFFDEYRIDRPLSAISPNMQHAIVAIEDARFFKHGGVDPKGLIRAAVVNQIHGGYAQGASTLTQQLVKNVLVEAAHARGDAAGQAEASDKTTARKLKEIHYAITLEKRMSKLQILNAYLNIAWFGGKVNGIEAASQYYFHTSAKKLTVGEAATLAGMIQSPRSYDPESQPVKSVERRNVVLDKMRDQGMITPKIHDATVKTKLGARITKPKQGCANSGVYAYFCDYVFNILTEDKAFTGLGSTVEDRIDKLERGGLTIRTTMQPKLELAAFKAMNKVIPVNDKSHVATASVTVEPGTGKVLTIQQNKIYRPTNAQFGPYTTIDYSTDFRYGGSLGFPTGSTFKPFTLATWLKNGKSLNASVSSETGVAPFTDFKSCIPLDRHQSYTYGNSEGAGHGNMSVWNGTAASVNGVFVSMEKQLNLCDIRSTAEDIGVHLAAPRQDYCSTEHPQPQTNRLPICSPSLTLGVASISPMTMASAYAAFAAKGTYCAPIAVLSLKDRYGKALPIQNANCKQTLDENVANTVNMGLSRVFKPGGTAASVGPLPDRPASGKTGTTNDSVDTWFAGYTPQLATAVWVGDPHTYGKGRKASRRSLNTLTINGVRKHVFGATYAAPIWKKIMTVADKGLPVKHFQAPNSSLLTVPQATVPSVEGKSVSDAISELEDAGFSTKVSNTMEPSQYPAGTVASTSPGGGSRTDSGSEITINVSSGPGAGDGGGKPGLGGIGGGIFGGAPPKKHKR